MIDNEKILNKQSNNHKYIILSNIKRILCKENEFILLLVFFLYNYIYILYDYF